VSGHGHVTPNPDGAKARCGGPGLCSECSRELVRKQEREGQPWPTGMRLHDGEPWDVRPDLKPDDADTGLFTYVHCAEHFPSRMKVPVARLRRIGWLDQKGRVWLSMPNGTEFDGGSLTPLLIDPGERDGC
jgi:hypothetical protein